jgi:hypothetical protein
MFFYLLNEVVFSSSIPKRPVERSAEGSCTPFAEIAREIQDARAKSRFEHVKAVATNRAFAIAEVQADLVLSAILRSRNLEFDAPGVVTGPIVWLL